jgi:hypothetical protein
MLFMVIEKFKSGGARPVGERFKAKGRMLPGGVGYQRSWVDAPGGRCFQMMEAPGLDLLKQWIQCWDDLSSLRLCPWLRRRNFGLGARTSRLKLR